MTPERYEALCGVLFSPSRCTDPAGALAEAGEELDLDLTFGNLGDLSDEQGERLQLLIEELFPDRTERIVDAAARWARRP